VAGDAASDVDGRDTCLVAEHRDDRVIDVGQGDSASAEGEQQVDSLACAAVEKLRLGGAHRLPDVEGLAEDRVDRLGERGAGLVRRNIEQADRITHQDLIGVTGEGFVVVLPANAADPQAGDLVAALPGRATRTA
jgi:hypothetical protein